MSNKSAILSSDEDLEFLQSLKKDFYIETMDSIEKAESLLLNFESKQDELSLLDYKRILHSIKGSAKAIDEAEFALLVHKVEDSILKDKNAAFFDLNFQFIDFCKNYIDLKRSEDDDGANNLLKEFMGKIKT